MAESTISGLNPAPSITDSALFAVDISLNGLSYRVPATVIVNYLTPFFVTNLTGDVTSVGNSTTIAALGSFAAAKGANTDLTSLGGITGNINLNSSPVNLQGSGIISSFTAGQNLVFGDPTYVDSTGKMFKADMEFSAPASTHLCLGTYATNQTGNFLSYGYARNDSWSWTVGGLIYLSTTSTLTQTIPPGAADGRQVLGEATASNIIRFSPSPIIFTPTGYSVSISSSAAAARTALGAASSGLNSDITQLISLSTPLSIGQGGTAGTSQATAQSALNVPSTTGIGASGTWGINISGNAATTTTNANLTGVITSVGNATSIASQTGTGSKFVVDTSPTLVTPNIGTPSAGVLTNCSGTASALTAGHVTTNANLTGDVTSSGNATTLATVNTNTGSYGSSSTVPVITVNGKGLITGVSTSTITPSAIGAAASGANSDITSLLGLTGDIIGPTGVTMANNGAFKTDTTVGHSAKSQVYDTTNLVYRTFISGTAGTTPTFAISQPTNGALTFDGGVIGGVTPPSGSFTALNATGQPNFSGATVIQKYVSANTSTAYALDAVNGTFFDLTLNGNCTITVTESIAANQSQFSSFKITQDGTGGRTLAFAGVTWLSGSPPVMPAAIGAYITGGLISINNVIYGYVQLQSTDSITLNALTLSTGLVGITSGSSKSAGYVGEVIQASVASGSAVSLTTATVTEITHIDLTSGLWMISANPTFLGTAITGTELQAFYSTASSTSTAGQDTYNTSYSDPFSATTTGRATASISGYILNLSGNGSIYLKAKATFTIGTCTAYGGITAVRIA